MMISMSHYGLVALLVGADECVAFWAVMIGILARIAAIWQPEQHTTTAMK